MAEVKQEHRAAANLALTGHAPEPGWPAAAWVETGEGLHPIDRVPRERVAQALADIEHAALERGRVEGRKRDWPRKAIEVQITANGFTWAEVNKALRDRVAMFEERNELGIGCSACGYGASHTGEVQLREVSRDQFADESIAWLDRQRKVRNG